MFRRITNVFLSCFFVALVAANCQADLLLTEEFETDGDGGVRYLSSTFTDSNDYFHRHDYGTTNPHPSQTNQTLNSLGGGAHMEWAWAMEDITDSNNPLTDESILRLNDIVPGGILTDVTVEIEVAAIYDTSGGQPDTYETDEPLQIQYAYGANSGGTSGMANPTLTNGTYATVGQFAGTDVSGDGPSLDSDMDGTGDGVSILDNELTNFVFSVPNGTGNLSIQIRAFELDGSDEYVFDNIRVFGTVTVVPEPSTFVSFSLLGMVLYRRRRKA